jgi:hypothetical protein
MCFCGRQEIKQVRQLDAVTHDRFRIFILEVLADVKANNLFHGDCLVEKNLTPATLPDSCSK